MNALPSSSSQLFFLEERRRQCLQDLATLIQKIYRGWKCRTQFLLLKKSQIVVSAWYRRYAVRPPFFSAGMRSRQRIKQNGKTESCIRCFQSFLLFFPSHSNKRSTRGSRAPPLWCSPTPEDGRCAPSCALLRIKCSRNELWPKWLFACYISSRPVNSWDSWSIRSDVRRQRPPSQPSGMAPRYWRIKEDIRELRRASAWVSNRVHDHD